MEQQRSDTSKPIRRCRCGHRDFDHFDRAIWLCHGPADPDDAGNPGIKPGAGWINLCDCKNYSPAKSELDLALENTLQGRMNETKRLASRAILEVWRALKWKNSAKK